MRPSIAAARRKVLHAGNFEAEERLKDLAERGTHSGAGKMRSSSAFENRSNGELNAARW